ncbi:MAG: hypothetical protein WAN05_31460, partial [Roseiarcus sp.]
RRYGSPCPAIASEGAGDSGRARTCDLPLRRRLPYPNDTSRSRNIITLILKRFLQTGYPALRHVDNSK